MINIGQRITVLRAARGITQTELAQRVGTSQGYINKLEAGRNLNPTINTLVALADALQVPVAALVAQEDAAKVA